jgi:hypothetical protein
MLQQLAPARQIAVASRIVQPLALRLAPLSVGFFSLQWVSSSDFASGDAESEVQTNISHTMLTIHTLLFERTMRRTNLDQVTLQATTLKRSMRPITIIIHRAS